jgi:hypothetical protein
MLAIKHVLLITQQAPLPYIKFVRKKIRTHRSLVAYISPSSSSPRNECSVCYYGLNLNKT